MASSSKHGRQIRGDFGDLDDAFPLQLASRGRSRVLSASPLRARGEGPRAGGLSSDDFLERQVEKRLPAYLDLDE